MPQLSEVDVFIRVVDAGSYATAAKAMGISRSHASRMVTALEQRLGVRLLHRTTRRISTTQTGQSFYEACAPLLEALTAAEARAAAERDEVVGTLRISVPSHFGLRYLTQPIAGFQRQYPGLDLALDYNDRKVDLVAEGYDLAVRGGAVENASLVAKRLWPFQLACYAAPSYLREHGMPRAPGELATHRALIYTTTASPKHWRLRQGDDEFVAQVAGPIQSNSSEALLASAVSGLGVIYLPDFVVAEAVRRGDLVRVLPGWSSATTWFWAVRPHRTHLPARVRLFLEFLGGLWTTPPWIIPPTPAAPSS